MLTLKDAAEYVKTSKATKMLLIIFRRLTGIKTFEQERENRLSRFVAITEAYKKGNTVASIAEKYGCSKRTVFTYIEMAGIERNSFIPSEIKAKVIRDYKNGMPVAGIIALHNVKRRYVQTVVKEAGLSRYRKNVPNS